MWVVDPAARTVSISRGPNDTIVLHESDQLTDDDVVPGFRLAVADIFAV